MKFDDDIIVNDYKMYNEEIRELIRSGKSPEQIVRLIDGDSTYDEIEAEIEAEKEARREEKRILKEQKRAEKQERRKAEIEQYKYNKQLNALIKSGKSPEDAAIILNNKNNINTHKDGMSR